MCLHQVFADSWEVYSNTIYLHSRNCASPGILVLSDDSLQWEWAVLWGFSWEFSCAFLCFILFAVQQSGIHKIPLYPQSAAFLVKSPKEERSTSKEHHFVKMLFRLDVTQKVPSHILCILCVGCFGVCRGFCADLVPYKDSHCFHFGFMNTNG